MFSVLLRLHNLCIYFLISMPTCKFNWSFSVISLHFTQQPESRLVISSYLLSIKVSMACIWIVAFIIITALSTKHVSCRNIVPYCQCSVLLLPPFLPEAGILYLMTSNAKQHYNLCITIITMNNCMHGILFHCTSKPVN